MKGKTNYSSLTKFFAVSFLVWVCQYSNESSAIGKSRIEEHGKTNTLVARGGRVLREGGEVIAEERNIFLKEKLGGVIEYGQEDTDHNSNFPKGFNMLIQKENVQNGLNSLFKNEYKKRPKSPYESDYNVVDVHNTSKFNDNNKNLKEDINLIELEDFEKVQFFQKLNNKPAEETNPFTVPNKFTEPNSPPNTYNESAKQVNTSAPTDNVEEIHNTINVNTQPTNKPSSMDSTLDFSKLHNSINVSRPPANKPSSIDPTLDFSTLHNSTNVSRPRANKPSSIDPTLDFAKIHNALSSTMPKPKTSHVYRDNYYFGNGYSTLKDDFYYDQLFNSPYKTDNYESTELPHTSYSLYDDSIRYGHYKNYFNDFNKNGTYNLPFDNMYNHSVKENYFDSGNRGRAHVDNKPRNDSGKPSFDFSEYFPKESYEKYPNDMKKNPYPESRLSTLTYVQNIEKLLNKLKYFNNVEAAVDELKNDPSYKKILDELKNGNGFEKLLYILKYSGDSERILSEFKDNDNIEKLIYVLNYYDKNSEPPKKEELKKEELKKEELKKEELKKEESKKEQFKKEELKKVASKKDHKKKSKLSFLKIKKKNIIVCITKLFYMFDKMYEDQLLDLFSSESDDDSTGNKKSIRMLKYVKILIPMAIAAGLITVLGVLKHVTYVIISVIIVAAAIGYTLFKLKKCHHKKKVERINKENAQKASKPTIIKVAAS
ncbi:hypothetical protein AK88_00315 [Plasmodium fragile]|uniref:Pv-fam-d protein n=1 Tax=Plasmodium fragile TaxID=5857 RepID=A0A0D9QUC1_PLAFR|nr:uncharacterized protein AK88_00315 [Plasmodium fragile]KJP90146.1 hypothetical protein AK88_00315 [Plasmodium fragile]